MLNRPAFAFSTHDRLLAERLVATLLAERPAAGRPGGGRAPRRSERPALLETALTVVRWARDGRPFGQGALQVAGLSRTTNVRYLGIWSRLGLVTRVDDKGRPVPHGTTTPPGEAALWRLETAWTPQLVELMPAHWRGRLELAWWALQADVAEELIGRCLRMVPACNGDRILRAELNRAEHHDRRRARRQQRACRQAAERAERGRQNQEAPGMLRPLSDLAAWNCTPPRTEHSPSAPTGPSGRAPGTRAREARAAEPPRTGPSADQYRRLVNATLIENDTEGGLLFAELVVASEALGEEDPVSLFGGLANLAVRRRRSLAELVGCYCRTADQVRVDIADRVRNRDRDPVANPAAFAWRMVRYQLGDLPRPPRAGRPSWSRPRADLVGDQVEAEPSGSEPSRRLELYQPPPEPERRLTVEEMRVIRERALAAHRPAAQRDGPG